MRVRTITAGITLDLKDPEKQIQETANFLLSAKERFGSSGIDVQTVRLSTQRWETYPLEKMPLGIPDALSDIENIAKKSGIDFISVGPATTIAAIKMVPSIIEATSITCCSALIANEKGIHLDNIDIAAETIRGISKIASNGSKNFMFAAIANVRPDTPFFPASYHVDKEPCFSIGLESGSMISQAVDRTRKLSEFSSFLRHIYQERLKEMDTIASSMSNDMDFRGTDLSYAPGLEENASIALAVERLTGAPFGSVGTLSVCAAITSSLSGIEIKRCGYSGLMLPVLEDIGLGAGAEIGAFDIQKLLLYSSVCGTGLDAVPVPGDTPLSKLSSTMSDVAYMSYKLRKPLSVRLLPIPGKSPGDHTEMGSPYLNDCSILSLI